MVERLVYADSPSRDDTSDVQQVTVKINGLSKGDVEEIVDPLPCGHLEKPSHLEKVSLPAISTTAFAAVSAASKLVKAGWDASR